MSAVDHDVRGGAQLSHLIALRPLVHLHCPPADEVVPLILHELLEQAGVLERLRLARVNHGPFGDPLQNLGIGLGAVIDDDDLEVARAQILRQRV